MWRCQASCNGERRSFTGFTAKEAELAALEGSGVMETPYDEAIVELGGQIQAVQEAIQTAKDAKKAFDKHQYPFMIKKLSPKCVWRECISI